MTTGEHLILCLQAHEDVLGWPVLDINEVEEPPFVVCTLIGSQPTPVLNSVGYSDLTEMWRIDAWQIGRVYPETGESQHGGWWRALADQTIRGALASPPFELGASRLLSVSSLTHLPEEAVETREAIQGGDTVFRAIRTYTLQTL